MALLVLNWSSARALGQAPSAATQVNGTKTGQATSPEPVPNEAAAPIPEKPAASKGPLKVICWYAKRDPVQTFQYKAYDVSKGQYSPAVDEWLKLVEQRFPDYVAYVRTLDLNPLSSETERQQVAHLIGRELTVITVHHYGLDPRLLVNPNDATSTGRSIGLGRNPYYDPTPSSPGFRPLPSTFPPLGAAGYSTGNRSTYANPVPAPYVRSRPP
jgi:hypothetical protein